jgi:hypothetical protein
MHRDAPEVSLPQKQQPSGSDRVATEPFVKPHLVGEYLGIDPATVVRFAKMGIIPGHPLRVSGQRMHWRFLLSEIRRVMLAKGPKHMLDGRTK